MGELRRMRENGQILTVVESSIDRIAKDLIDYWKIWKIRSNTDLRPWMRQSISLNPQDTAVGYLEFEKGYNTQIHSYVVNYRTVVDRSEKAMRGEIAGFKGVMYKRWNELGMKNEQELKEQGYL